MHILLNLRIRIFSVYFSIEREREIYIEVAPPIDLYLCRFTLTYTCKGAHTRHAWCVYLAVSAPYIIYVRAQRNGIPRCRPTARTTQHRIVVAHTTLHMRERRRKFWSLNIHVMYNRKKMLAFLYTYIFMCITKLLMCLESCRYVVCVYYKTDAKVWDTIWATVTG